MPLDSKRNNKWIEHLSVVMQVGLTMAGCIVFCFFIGRYLDRLLHTKGIFITIFTILGVIGGANVAYRQIMEVTQEGKNPKNDQRG